MPKFSVKVVFETREYFHVEADNVEAAQDVVNEQMKVPCGMYNIGTHEVEAEVVQISCTQDHEGVIG